MLKKRIIPCLDIKNGRTVKGVNFESMVDAGNPIELAKIYVQEGADELVFLDITATLEQRQTRTALVRQLAKEINIPFSVGGGIQTVEEAKTLIEAGADKISVNSSALKNPTLIADLAKELGSQCVIVAIDTKFENGNWMVFSSGGTLATQWKAKDWAKEAERLGAGEILLTSMDHDGTKNGFAIELTNEICALISIPVIASGGAGSMAHFAEIFTQTKASGALAASVFHFREIPIPTLKNYLKTQQIPIR